MANSNVVNGHDYFNLQIQVVSTSDTQYVLRAVIYLVSYNVIDSVNNLSVTGNWSRSGALALNGVYNATAVWSQDITVNRVYGSATNVSVSASWSGVEYWGATLSASESYSVPARPVYPPSAPGTPTVSAVEVETATLSWTAPSATNGSAVDYYQVQVDDDPAFGSPVISTTDTASPYAATGLPPGTVLKARVRAHNSAGYGAWSGTATFETLSGAKVRIGGVWVNAKAHVRVGGAWVPVKVHKRVAGSWVL